MHTAHREPPQTGFNVWVKQVKLIITRQPVYHKLSFYQLQIRTIAVNNEVWPLT